MCCYLHVHIHTQRAYSYITMQVPSLSLQHMYSYTQSTYAVVLRLSDEVSGKRPKRVGYVEPV